MRIKLLAIVFMCTLQASPLQDFAAASCRQGILSFDTVMTRAAGLTPSHALRELVSTPNIVIVIKFSVDHRCGRCRTFAPIFERAVQAISLIAGRPALYLYVDTEKYADLCRDFSVSTTPSIMVYYHGKLISYNAMPASAFDNYLRHITIQ